MEVCAICDGQGHVRNKQGEWERCACVQEEIKRQELGIFYVDTVLKQTSLTSILDRSAVIETPLDAIRPHVACVMNQLRDQSKTFAAMDCYRLVEIFLRQDEVFDTTAEVAETDLLIVLLGFGDPRNRYLPELVLQAVSRREVMRKPTWIILGIAFEAIATKYGVDLANKLEGFKRVKMR